MSTRTRQPLLILPQSRSDIDRELPPLSKSTRVDILRFSRDNPTACVARIQRYFDYYQTVEPHRLIVSSFHLDGDALDWFEGMSRDGFIMK